MRRVLPRWLRQIARGLVMTTLAGVSLASLAATCPWPDWDAFRRDTISPDGRVVDASTERQATVSEGQAYALFFALVANDRATFDKLLGWTRTIWRAATSAPTCPRGSGASATAAPRPAPGA